MAKNTKNQEPERIVRFRKRTVALPETTAKQVIAAGLAEDRTGKRVPRSVARRQTATAPLAPEQADAPEQNIQEPAAKEEIPPAEEQAEQPKPALKRKRASDG